MTLFQCLENPPDGRPPASLPQLNSADHKIIGILRSICQGYQQSSQVISLPSDIFAFMEPKHENIEDLSESVTAKYRPAETKTVFYLKTLALNNQINWILPALPAVLIKPKVRKIMARIPVNFATSPSRMDPNKDFQLSTISPLICATGQNVRSCQITKGSACRGKLNCWSWK